MQDVHDNQIRTPLDKLAQVGISHSRSIVSIHVDRCRLGCGCRYCSLARSLARRRSCSSLSVRFIVPDRSFFVIRLQLFDGFSRLECIALRGNPVTQFCKIILFRFGLIFVLLLSLFGRLCALRAKCMKTAADRLTLIGYVVAKFVCRSFPDFIMFNSLSCLSFLLFFQIDETTAQSLLYRWRVYPLRFCCVLIVCYRCNARCECSISKYQSK